jgi:LacI family transcriptional regulator
MAVTIRDVAQRAGVSAMTVSRVINGSPSVRPETQAAVEAAIAELRYVPNSLARGLTSHRSGTIGLVVPDLGDPFFTLVLRGAEQVARAAGYRVIVCNTNSDLEIEAGYIDDLIARQMEGVILAPVDDRSSAVIERMDGRPIPHVLLDRSIPGVAADIVQGDSVGGARLLVEHLLAAGHRRIGHITEPQTVSTARDRHRGYREALEAHGIAYDPALVVEGSGATIAGARDATGELLGRGDPPTAIFAVNNLAAVGVVLAVRAAGLSVPGDVAVACFDDIELAAYLCPFLTVMAQPATSYGTLATELLLQRIQGTALGEPQSIILPGKLIVRESTVG